MSETISTTTVAEILKTVYAGGEVPDACYKDTWFFDRVKKSDEGGKNYVQVVKYGRQGNGGPVFSTAQDNTIAPNYEDFTVTYAKTYLPFTINRDLIKQSAGKGAKAFVDALKDEVDGAYAQMGQLIEQACWQDTGGAIGQVGSLSTTTLTLKNTEDVVNFQVGDEIKSAETDGTSGSLQSGSATVTGIDRDAGTLTTDSDWDSQIATLDADDYLFIIGHFGAKQAGVKAWVPTSAPSASESFFGVDRSVDATRLAGCRVSASGKPVDIAIQNLAERMGREGVRGNLDMCISANRYNDLAKSLQTQRIYNDSKAVAGFQSVQIATAAGVWNVHPVTFCPDSYGWALDMSTWKIVSAGAVPEIIKDDGSMLSRSASADSFEVRLAAYWNLCCSDPSRNGCVSF